MESEQPASPSWFWLCWALQIWMVWVEFAHQDVPVLAILLPVLLFGETAVLDRFDEVNGRGNCLFRKRRVVAGERVHLLLQKLRDRIAHLVQKVDCGTRAFNGHSFSYRGVGRQNPLPD
jgi:hypothetical protein